MLDATDATTSFVSVELDAERAAASARLFAAFPNVQVLQGDWTGLVHHGPFDLLVLDGGGKGKDRTVDSPIDPAAGWLAVGGMIVLDDFTPTGQPGAAEHDEARRYWLEHPVAASNRGSSLVDVVDHHRSAYPLAGPLSRLPAARPRPPHRTQPNRFPTATRPATPAIGPPAKRYQSATEHTR